MAFLHYGTLGKGGPISTLHALEYAASLNPFMARAATFRTYDTNRMPYFLEV